MTASARAGAARAMAAVRGLDRPLTLLAGMAFVTGIGVYAGANILIATATAAIPLIAFRALAGLGGGVNQIAERLYLTEVSERSRRAFANGILSAAGAAGSVMGPAVGGLLVAVSDLRVPFLLVGTTSALATLGALFLPRPSVRAEAGLAPPAPPPPPGDRVA